MKKNMVRSERKTGCPADYDSCRMSPGQTAVGAAAGIAAVFIIIYIFFENAAAALFLGVISSFYSVRLYRRHVIKKRKSVLTFEFRDYIESVSASLSGGQNISRSLICSCEDMKMQYGENSYIYAESKKIADGIKNGFTAEELIMDFAQRSHLNDVMSFAQTFSICNRMGGNMKKILGQTHKILSDKMTAQAEIETMASQGKNELCIMTGIPLIIVPAVKTLGYSGMDGDSLVNIIVRAVCLAVIASAFAIGQKMIHIRV